MVRHRLTATPLNYGQPSRHPCGNIGMVRLESEASSPVERWKGTTVCKYIGVLSVCQHLFQGVVHGIP